MSSGWNARRLADVCHFSNGLWKGEKPPFINVGVVRNTNFTKEGTLDDSDIAYLDVEIKKFAKRQLQYGDIILEKSGGGPKQPVGRVVLFDKSEGNFSFSNFTAALQVIRPEELDFRFLHKFLHWTYLSGVTEGLQSHSTGIRNLDSDAYKGIVIRFPDLLEQQRIVSILDDAFEAIATAKANAEKNVQNARALFESYLQAVFTRRGDGWMEKRLDEVANDFGRGRSRHRPRNDPRLYDGPYPFIQTGDVRNSNHLITAYSQTYSEAGLAQSKLWPAGTLCVTIAANIAETGILAFEACFPDSVIGIVVNEAVTTNKYLEYMLQSFKARLQAAGKGSAQDNINLGTFETQTFPFPSLSVQAILVSNLDTLREKTQRLESIYQRKLSALDELKKSLLHRAFAGELTASEPTIIPISAAAERQAQKDERRLSTTDRHAGLLALAYRAHERAGKLPYFGHVKAEKIAHMMEARLGIDLGRAPVKDAAGPNDYPHLMKVEHRARNAQFFDFKRVDVGYRVSVLPGFDRLIERTRDDLGERYDEVMQLIELMLPMDTERAEILATVYAAWNNLLLDGLQPTDEDIVRAAREDWHPDKLKIERTRFFKAIQWMRDQGLTPTGTGTRVADRTDKTKPATKRK